MGPSEASRRLWYPTPPISTRMSVFDTAGTGVHLLHDGGVARVDMGCARHAWIEAAQRSQDVDTLEVFGLVEFFQQRRLHHGFLVRSRIPERVLRRCIQRGGRDDLVVDDRALIKLQMMRKPAAAGTPETHTHTMVFRHCKGG